MNYTKIGAGALTALLISSCNNIGSGSDSLNSQSSQSLKSQGHGVIVNEFADPKFSNLTSIYKLEQPDQHLQSHYAKIKGFYLANQTGNYQINAKNDDNLKIIGLSINHKYFVTSDKPAQITLKANTLYEIEVAVQSYNPKAAQLELIIVTPDGKNSTIHVSDLLLPSNDYSALKKTSLLTAVSGVECKIGELVDSDCDGIPNDWENNGYVVVVNGGHKEIRSYNPESYPTAKVLYSNPYAKSTTQDFYSDLDKALNNIASIKNNDPLVANYPKPILYTDNAIVKGVNQKTEQISDAHTYESGFTDTKADSVAEKASIKYSTKTKAGFNILPKAEVEVGFEAGFEIGGTHQWTHAYSERRADTLTIANSLGVDTSRAADLQVNFNYLNVGNTPAANVIPTVSLIIGKDYTLKTITLGDNLKALVLNPGEAYPKSGSSLALTDIGNAARSPINLYSYDLDYWQATRSFDMNLTQFSANALRNVNGEPTVDSATQWLYQMPQIMEVSVPMLLNMPGLLQERAVYAVDPEDINPNPNLKLTLREAFKRAFNASEVNGKFIIKDGIITRELSLDNVAVNYNAAVTNALKKQSLADVWSLKLERGFAFGFAIKYYYDYNGSRYYYYENGFPLQGFNTTLDEPTIQRYFVDGVPISGLVKYDNFTIDPNLAVNNPSKYLNFTTTTYCVDQGFTSNLVNYQGLWYYCPSTDKDNHYIRPFNQTIQFGIKKLNNNLYFFTEQGIARTGEFSDSGKWYYGDPVKGYLVDGDVLMPNGVYASFDSATGVKKILSKTKTTINLLSNGVQISENPRQTDEISPPQTMLFLPGVKYDIDLNMSTNKTDMPKIATIHYTFRESDSSQAKIFSQGIQECYASNCKFKLHIPENIDSDKFELNLDYKLENGLPGQQLIKFDGSSYFYLVSDDAGKVVVVATDINYPGLSYNRVDKVLQYRNKFSYSLGNLELAKAQWKLVNLGNGYSELVNKHYQTHIIWSTIGGYDSGTIFHNSFYSEGSINNKFRIIQLPKNNSFSLIIDHPYGYTYSICYSCSSSNDRDLDIDMVKTMLGPINTGWRFVPVDEAR